MPRIVGSFWPLLTVAMIFPARGSAREGPSAPSMESSAREFLASHCVRCHSPAKAEGGVRLDDIPLSLSTVGIADRWQKVLNQVNSGAMPPEGAKPIPGTAKADFLEALSTRMAAARRHLADSGGHSVMRRLNRREYKNTIRDLLGVEISARELPADGGAGTFDTVGSSLFMSGDQVEQYLAIGRQALDEHFARQVPSRVARRMHLEAEDRNARITKSLKDRLDARDKYLKWTAAVDAAAKNPVNAEAVAGIREEKKGETHLYFQWRKVAGAPSPKEFGFIDAINADEEGRRNWVHYVPHHQAYVRHPATKTGAFLTVEDVFVNPYHPFRVPGDWPAGDYVVRVRIAATENTPKERHFVEFGPQHDSGVRAVASSHQVTGTMANPQVLEIPLKFSPSKGHGFFLQEKGTYGSEAIAHQLFSEGRKRNGIGPEFALWIDWIEVEGPVGAAAPVKTITERREVELHANRMVGGTYNGYFKGGYEAAKKFLETKEPQKGIPDELEAKFRIRAFEQHGPSFERYLNDPLTKTGSYLTIFNVHTEEVITLPPDQPSGWLKTKHEVEKAEPGEYKLRFRVGAVKGTPKDRHFVELGSRIEKDEFGLIKTFQITGTTEQPQVIEVPVSISANGPRTFALREKRNVKQDHEWYTASVKETKVGPPPALWIDWVEWEGPIPRQPPVAKVERVEPEKRRAEVERGHLRSKYLNEQYAKWKAAGGDEARLKEFGFTDKSHAEFGKAVWDGNNRWFQQYLDRPLSKTGLYLDNTVNETSEFAVDLPPDIATGDYVLRVKIGRVPDMPTERSHLMLVEASPIDKDDRTLLNTKQITATTDRPEVVELAFKVRPGGPRKFILMEKRSLKKEAISLPGRTRLMQDAKQRDPALWIDWIEYEGPLNPSNPSAPPPILASQTRDSAGARQIFEAFARRAFRDNPPQPGYIDKLVKLFETRLKAGDPFETAIREPLSVVLASPRFLYLAEPGETKASNQPIRLNSRELASRLSYFLWSAPPDETLLALARGGELDRPEVLAAQVDRMIDSEKSREFVNGFTHQWLGMERLDFFQFNTQLHRDFDESAKAAARAEVFRTIEHVLRANRGVGDLLKSDYVVVNGLLGTYYGLEGVTGDEFRKVALPPDSPRGGLLGMAAIMAMGSNGEVSSPVERGAWVLRKLLHDPPPPAPPNVPQLTRLEGKLLTTRERILAHQEQPQCASCHRKIDPIGFGLENFNAVGKWRAADRYEKRGVGKKEWTIDPSGAFHKGPAFKDFFELRDIIASRPEAFSRGLSEALVEYALGRPYGFSDQALADDMVRQAAGKNFALREFIHALVQSESFHAR